ncbi:MAG: helix-turn-helix transcriptional regulator [Labilibaculum sp.]|nr:helix-turn-helix transcriptional regulator [Labilibaculum sp.]
MAQNTQNDSISYYFKQINDLVGQQADLPNVFINEASLLKQLEHAHGEEKIAILFRLYKLHKYKSVTVADSYNSLALKLSKVLGYKKGVFQANANHGYLLFVNGLFNASMQKVKSLEAEIVFEDYPKCYADVFSLKSYIHTEKGEYGQALEIGLHLLDIAEKSRNKYVFMRAYAALSHYYLRIENYKIALSYCLKGLGSVIDLKEVHYIFPKIDEIARMSSKLEHRERAIEAYDFYIALEQKIDSPGDFIQSVVYMNMTDLYLQNGALNKAQDYLTQAMYINETNNFRFRIPRALILQAQLNLKKKDTTQAILNYEKSLIAAEHINAFDVVKSNSLILADLFGKRGDVSKVYEYKTLYKAIQDSLFTNEKAQKIIILEARRTIKEVSQKKRILELENLTQRSQFHLVLLALFLLIVVIGFVGFGYVKVKKQHKILFHKSIQLAEMQLKMRGQLDRFELNEKESVIIPTDTNQNKLNEDVKEIILAKLDKLEESLFFLDQQCTLNQMALVLKTNVKYVSQVINQEKKNNFNNYINDLRINYLLGRLLADVDFRECKLSYISVSSGYNNLNTFNAAFKKRQGILPSYFISELIQKDRKK